MGASCSQVSRREEDEQPLRLLALEAAKEEERSNATVNEACIDGGAVCSMMVMTGSRHECLLPMAKLGEGVCAKL